MPPEQLVGNLPLQVTTTTNPANTSPLQSPTGEASQASSVRTPTNAFREAFGTPAGNPRANIPSLVQARTQLFQPVLEKALKDIHCSTLSRHLWSHCQHLDFETKSEVSDWCKRNLRLEIVFTGSAISLLKTAATKDCRLCMKERITLFRHFGKKKSHKNNMMNSRKEMHGKCSCVTRFIRLRSVENESADEATS